jgi:hypothetical protein
VVVSGLATYRVETCVKLDPARSQRCAYWTLWGNYDQEPVYAAVENHSPGARVIIPPVVLENLKWLKSLTMWTDVIIFERGLPSPFHRSG